MPFSPLKKCRACTQLIFLIPATCTEIQNQWARMCTDNAMACNNTDNPTELALWSLSTVRPSSSLGQIFRAILSVSEVSQLPLMESTITLLIMSLQILIEIPRVQNLTEFPPSQFTSSAATQNIILPRYPHDIYILSFCYLVDIYATAVHCF